MIEFHRPAKDDFCDGVEDTFHDLVVAYKTYRYDEDESKSAEHHIPYIIDDEMKAVGEDEIKEYMYQLRIDLESMRAFTGDACYIDPESGEIC